MKQFRSKFEQTIKKQLDDKKVKYLYESENLAYIVPETKHEYWPDLLLPNGIYIELKGYLDPTDRRKLELVKKQHPNKDIRIIFQSPNNKIYKSSKVTYGDWATRIGFKWASRVGKTGEWIPDSWLHEPPRDGKNHLWEKFIEKVEISTKIGRWIEWKISK